jgi:hypothetical protein
MLRPFVRPVINPVIQKIGNVRAFKEDALLGLVGEGCVIFSNEVSWKKWTPSVVNCDHKRSPDGEDTTTVGI